MSANDFRIVIEQNTINPNTETGGKVRPMHKYTILKKLYDTKLHLTATDFNASNANQYLIELESQDLIERYSMPREGMSDFKLSYVSDDTREKSKKYLDAFNGVKSKKDNKLPKSKKA